MPPHFNDTTYAGWKAQASLGTPATGPFTAFGTGTLSIVRQSNNKKRRSNQSAALTHIKGGARRTAVSYNFDSIHDYGAVELIQKTAGVLTPFTVVGGYDETTDILWTVQDCYAQSLALRCTALNDIGELTGTLSAIGGKVTPTTTAATVSALGEEQFLSNEVIMTYLGAGFEITGFDLNIAWALDPIYTMVGAARTSTAKRMWDHLKPGNLDISGSFTRLDPWSGDIDADCLAGGTAVIRFVDACDATNILEVTLTGLFIDEHGQDTPSDGMQGYNLPWTAKTFTIAHV